MEGSNTKPLFRPLASAAWFQRGRHARLTHVNGAACGAPIIGDDITHLPSQPSKAIGLGSIDCRIACGVVLPHRDQVLVRVQQLFWSLSMRSEEHTSEL